MSLLRDEGRVGGALIDFAYRFVDRRFRRPIPCYRFAYRFWIHDFVLYIWLVDFEASDTRFRKNIATVARLVTPIVNLSRVRIRFARGHFFLLKAQQQFHEQ